MALFSNRQESNLRSCVQMVEDVIKSLGHNPDESRIEQATPTWRVQKGSAFVTVSLSSAEDENQIQVSAGVLRLDAKVDRLRLFQRLLELNASTIKGAAFGLQDDQVVLVAERSTLDLDLSEVKQLIQTVEEYADHYDDALVGEFGGTIVGPGRR
jgi:Putative bacterial sensory transduction regulator